MLFHKFVSQEERRALGGSDFIELQYCRLAHGCELKKIVSADAVSHWKNDSLYVSGDDANVFFSNYGEIFCGGIYSSGESGAVDVCGINYYPPAVSDAILRRVRERQPLEYVTLCRWLGEVKKYNGFYILGV